MKIKYYLYFTISIFFLNFILLLLFESGLPLPFIFLVYLTISLIIFFLVGKLTSYIKNLYIKIFCWVISILIIFYAQIEFGFYQFNLFDEIEKIVYYSENYDEVEYFDMYEEHNNETLRTIALYKYANIRPEVGYFISINFKNDRSQDKQYYIDCKDKQCNTNNPNLNISYSEKEDVFILDEVYNNINIHFTISKNELGSSSGSIRYINDSTYYGMSKEDFTVWRSGLSFFNLLYRFLEISRYPQISSVSNYRVSKNY